MIALPSGWYVFCAPTRERQATDLHGPFASQADVEDWLMDNGIVLLPKEPPADAAVRYFNEMRDDDLDDADYDPWACCIHHRAAEGEYRNTNWVPPLLDPEWDAYETQSDDYTGGPEEW